jgi:PhoD-like phosphatase
VPELVIGPLLRHVGETDATVWVETDGPCEVSILDRSARTFHVAGHHYALVCIEGLEAGHTYPYEVALDGETVWPERDTAFPPSAIRTFKPENGLRIVFGSCRVSAPHEPPFTRSSDEDEQGYEVDALWTYTRRMIRGEATDTWPDAIILLGDQVYADDVSPRTLARIESYRSTSEPPGEEIANFEEYTWLYEESWSDPTIGWFMANVSTAMLFDDHDVHDDWNISQSWVEDMHAEPWWEDRIVGAFVSYWIYQHLGNLSPAELAEDSLYPEVLAADDAWPVLREFALRSDREPNGTRWSFCRDYGRTRLIAIDCRAGRVLEPGARRMVDEEEWDWIVDRSKGDYDHVLFAMSDPFILPRGIHDVQTWNEAVCNGAWGKTAARLGEKMRRSIDFDHWSAFDTSFRAFARLVGEIAAGKHGRAPGSVVAMAGDVHNAYLAEVGFPEEVARTSPVYQAVCSPYRNPLSAPERRGQLFGQTRTGKLIGRAMARAAGVPPAPVGWRFLDGPCFQNQIATLKIDGRRSRLRLESVGAWDGDGAPPDLEIAFERTLAP